MGASTALITDMTSVITNGPNAASLAKAINPTGPIMDYQGNCRLSLLKLQEAERLLTLLISVTDSGDASKTTLTAVVHAIDGLSAPSSALLTDMKTAIAAGPAAATKANAISATGPIDDYPGIENLVLLKLDEANVLLTSIKAVTDSTDATNLTLINNLLTALA